MSDPGAAPLRVVDRLSLGSLVILAYLIFLLTFSFGKVKGFSGTIYTQDRLGIGAAIVAFVVNRHMSYRRHRESDSRGCPNIGTLMFLPYARIVPMHLVIIVGASVGGAGSLLLFGALKTGADALMHWVEHRAPAGAGTRASDA